MKTSLHKHNSKGIIISWAVKGQGGHHHVNCQNADYVIPLFQNMGYQYNKQQSEKIRKTANLKHFRKTIYVFERVWKNLIWNESD